MHDAEVINRVGRISRRQQQRFRPNFKGRAGRAVLDREAHEAYPRRDPESHKLGAGQISGRPTAVGEAENRRMQDYIVNWVQGLAAHIDQYKQTQDAARQSDAQ